MKRMNTPQLTVELCKAYSTPVAKRTALLNLMNIFHTKAKHSELRYWATGGTLLGVVRHGTLIPWDDDLDIIVHDDDSVHVTEVLDAICTEHRYYTWATFNWSPVITGWKLKHAGVGDLDIFRVKTIKKGEQTIMDTFWTNEYYYESELGNLVERPFGNGVVMTPEKCEPYLTRQYPLWREIAEVYNHSTRSRGQMRIDPDELVKVNAWLNETLSQGGTVKCQS